MTDIEFAARCKKLDALLKKIEGLVEKARAQKQVLQDEMDARLAA